jgi:hypothetical protein
VVCNLWYRIAHSGSAVNGPVQGSDRRQRDLSADAQSPEARYVDQKSGEEQNLRAEGPYSRIVRPDREALREAALTFWKLRKDVKISIAIVIGALILAILTLLLTDPNTPCRHLTQGIILGGLALGVPIRFLWEYATQPTKMTPCQLDELKYGQELARNFWLAMLAVLAFMFGLIDWPG